MFILSILSILVLFCLVTYILFYCFAFLDFAQPLQFAVAVAELIGRHAHFIQQRQEQIRHRRFGVHDMPSCFQRTIATSDNDGWQVYVRVTIAVAVRAAVHDHAMIQQRAVAFLNGFQLADEVGELL